MEFEEIERLTIVATKPFEDETLNGLIGRHAMLNHWDRFAWIRPYTKQAFPKRRHNEEALRRLSRLFGISVEALAATQPTLRDSVTGAWKCTLNGKTVPFNFFIQKGRRACPQCLVESNHHRDIWDFQFVRSCPVHRVRLLAACPCGRALDWYTGAFHYCRAAKIEAEAVAPPDDGNCIDLRTVKVASVTDRQISGQTFLLDVMAGRATSIPPLLQGLGVEHLVIALLSIGSLALRIDADQWEPGLDTSGASEELDDGVSPYWEAALSVGMEILKSSAEEFQDRLKRWHDRAGRTVYSVLRPTGLVQGHVGGAQSFLSGEIMRGIPTLKLSPGDWRKHLAGK